MSEASFCEATSVVEFPGVDVIYAVFTHGDSVASIFGRTMFERTLLIPSERTYPETETICPRLFSLKADITVGTL